MPSCSSGFSRREDKERIGQRISLVPDRDLAFLHRLEQRALHLGRRAIDFVRQDQVRKNRTELGREFTAARIVNQRADQIGGQQVGRKLETLKTGLNAGRHRFDGERLGEAGNAFEEDVAIGEQSEQKPVDQIFLSDDDVTDLLAQRRNPLSQLLDLLGNLLR